MQLKFTELLLLYVSERSLIFEMIEIVGLDNTLKLLSVFEGEKIEFPNKDTLHQAVLNLYIYSQLQKNPDNEEILGQLTKRFSLSLHSIRKRFSQVSSDLDSSEILKGLKIPKEELEIHDIENHLLSLLV